VLARVRLTRGEVCQAIRSSGYGDLELVAAVVLETDGSLSVVDNEHCHTASAMPSTAAGSVLAVGENDSTEHRSTGARC
jgi:uncharacterized membrane protein YcaP (DUF421 family)